MYPSHWGGIKEFAPRALVVLAVLAFLLNMDGIFGAPPAKRERAVEDMETYQVVEDRRVPVLASYIARRFNASEKVAQKAVLAAFQASRETGLPASLILGVAAVESRFRPRADNGVDKGIMQVNPRWHPEKVARIGGAAKLFDVGAGVKVGAQVLKEYSVSKDGHVVKMLLRYNGATLLNAYPGRVLAEKHRFDQILDSVRGS